MDYQTMAFSVVAVGAICQHSTAMTAEVTLPFMTNIIEVPRGGELVMEAVPPEEKKRKEMRTWKDDVKEKKPKAARTSKHEDRSDVIEI